MYPTKGTICRVPTHSDKFFILPKFKITTLFWHCTLCTFKSGLVYEYIFCQEESISEDRKDDGKYKEKLTTHDRYVRHILKNYLLKSDSFLIFFWIWLS